MIEGARVILRPVGEEDARTINRWESDYYIETTLGSGPDRHLIQSEDKSSRIGAKTAKMFAVESRDGQLIGCIGLVEISWRKSEAELVIVIGEERYRGKGYGREAMNVLLDYAFSQTKLGRVYLRVFKDNASAVKCFEKCGFRSQWMIARRFEAGGPVKRVLLMTLEKKDFLEMERRHQAS